MGRPIGRPWKGPGIDPSLPLLIFAWSRMSEVPADEVLFVSVVAMPG